MSVYTLDPLSDPRWAEFTARHAEASIFHSVPWLQAIRRTYGYVPIVYTTSAPPASLSNGIVLCQINSWMTGRRMVSVPFSDHCEPLLDTRENAFDIFQALRNTRDRERWDYIELRPKSNAGGYGEMTRSPACYLHTLNIARSADELLSQTHKTCIQGAIKRAMRGAVEYRCGTSEPLLQAFYRLMVETRRRHKLPPQPIQWFRNLVASMGDRLQIRAAFSQGTEIAAILTLQHGTTVTYKYGCSDARFNNLGATPLLLWNTIIEARQSGMTSMDFGRTDSDNPGLITFKNRWGTQASSLVYVRWCQKANKNMEWRRSSGILEGIVPMMPDFVLRAAGRILYRHVG